MFGWRARIGFISPNLGGLPGTLFEMEHLAPEGVAFLTRFVNGPASLATAELLALAADVEPLARSLVQAAELDVILMAGAPVVLANGPDTVARILRDATGLPATTNVEGMINGLRRLDVQRVKVVTPYYPPNVNDLLHAHLVASGFEVVSIATGGSGAVEKRKEAAQEHAYRLARRAFLDGPAADGLLIVGGGAPINSVIEAQETDIGKPVVAAHLDGVWSALTIANVRQPIRGYGRLLTCL
jgi:maleate cis-trans isomerase